MIYSDFILTTPQGNDVYLNKAHDKTFDVQADFKASTIKFSMPTAEAKDQGVAEGKYLKVTVDEKVLPTPYVIESASWDYGTVDDVSVTEFSGRSIHAIGEDDVVFPSAWPNPTPSGHSFQNATPGTMIKTLIQRSQDRSKLLDWDHSSFTGVVDSNGRQWPSMADRSFNNGDSVLSVLQSLVDDGLVELAFDGFKLKAYVPSTLGRAVPIETVFLRPGYSISEGSVDSDFSDFATDVYAIGEGDATAYVTRPELYSVLNGRRKTKFVQYGGITDKNLLKVLAQADLDRYGVKKLEDSLKIPHEIYQPFTDYNLYDWLTLSRGDDTNTLVQVKQISIQASGDSYSVGVSLGSLIDSLGERIQRRLDAITGANAGGGAVPSDKTAIKVAPSVPTNLSTEVQPYLDNQLRRKVIAMADWSDVLTYSNGLPLANVDHYEVATKTGNATDFGASLSVDTSSAVFSGYDPDTLFQFRVRAFTDGLASPWVTSKAVSLIDNTPLVLAKPSLPVLTARWQTVAVRWDGKNSDDSWPSTDTHGVEVHVYPASGFTPSTSTYAGLIQITPGNRLGGLYTVSGLEPKTTYYVKFVPIGKQGTPGPASGESSITTSDLAVTAEQINAINTDLNKAKGDLYNPGGTVDNLKTTLTGQITAGDKAVDDRALSRGTDLVTNGTGTLGTNYNFSGFNVDKTDAPPGAVLSMYQAKGVQVVASTDEFMAVDTSKTYKLDAYIRQRGTSKTAVSYVGLAAYDAYKLNLNPQFVCWIGGTTTTLAADLNPGDTKIKISATKGWYGTSARSAGNATHNRSIIWWDYVDQGGKAWPVESYSRNWSGADYWADGAISDDGTITLRSPYSGPKRLAGTPLSNGTSGGTYIYGFSYGTATSEWKKLSQLNGYVNNGLITGVATGGVLPSFATGFPTGTAYVRVVMLPNWSDIENSQVAFAGVSLSDTSAAQVAALSAATAASTAQAAADAAKSTADAANTAAANAAGIANGKADVLIQSTAPAAAMQKASTLWIDTTNNLNTPKRWSGSAWVVVTDKAAVDAANAAANAQATANQAKTDAANAQAKADQAARDAAAAQATANSAVSKADAAQTSANGKNTVFWSTSNPSDTANPGRNWGDVWYKYAVINNKTQIFAQWYWYNTWVSTALSETFIPQLNIGTGTYGELDGMRLKAKSVQANNILVEGSAGTTVIADGAIITSKIAALAVTADQIAANAITADKIAANAITANEINAQSIGAAIGEFVKIKADQIDAGFLNASIGIGTNGLIIAGDWSKSYATMSANGFATYGVTSDGIAYQATALGGQGVDQLSINGPDGEVAAITNEGVISGETGIFSGDVSIKGKSLLGQRNEDADVDTEGWLDVLSAGSVLSGDIRNFITSGQVFNVGYTPIAVVGFTMDYRRQYRLTLPYRHSVTNITGSNGRCGVGMTYTFSTTSSSPPEPSTDDTKLIESLSAFTVAVGDVTNNISAIWTPANYGTPDYKVDVKILVYSWSAGCQFVPSKGTSFDWRVAVEDLGLVVDDSARSVLTAASTTPAKKTYTSTWTASDSWTFYQGGARDSYGRANDITRAGYWDSITGDMKTMCVFNNNATKGETTKTMATALSGATIKKAEVFVQSAHWYNPGGGTLVVRQGSGSTIPTTLADSTAKAGSSVLKKFTSRQQGFWITVPTSWFSTTNRSVYFGPANSTSRATYAHLYNHAVDTPSYRPQVRLTYIR